MVKYYETTPPYIVADSDKVLCDGQIMTGLGGRVSDNNTDALDLWQEMTEAEALALTTEEEATIEDYKAALAELGVVLDEES